MDVMIYFIVFLFFSSTLAHEKIKLTDIQVLTLKQGYLTTGRRSSPVPQLECVGGSAGCKDDYLPRTVQCKNMGSDGFNVQWKCQADLETKLKFGTVDVNCEGYDYPNDPYVFKGSCGLRYTLDTSGHSSKSHKYGTATEKSSWNGFYFVVFCIVACLLIYYFYLAPNTTGFQNASMPSTSNYGYPDEAPPPPGFRPDYTAPPAYESIYRNKRPFATHTGTENGPGFWTGLGAGGLMGYLFGSRTNQQTPFYQPTTGYSAPHTTWRDDYSTQPRHFSDSDETQEYRTASGFGGTSRR